MSASAKQVFLDNRDRLLAYQNVNGIWLGYRYVGGKKTDEVAIVVSVREKKDISVLSKDDILPSNIDGIKLDVFEAGEIKPIASVADPTRLRVVRPVPGGVSIGHYNITAGTAGCWVRDKNTNKYLLLSNNHVLANSNNAKVDDPIYQPGPLDGGRIEDAAFKLLRWKELSFYDTAPDKPPTKSTCPVAKAVVSVANKIAELFGRETRLQAVVAPRVVTASAAPAPANTVDAAVAKPLFEDYADPFVLSIGKISGASKASLGETVHKSGRTTSLTSGEVIGLYGMVDVKYGRRVARFTNQIITTDMSEPGDSGSLLVKKNGSDNQAVGLLFAGGSGVTIHNHISEVLSALEIYF